MTEGRGRTGAADVTWGCCEVSEERFGKGRGIYELEACGGAKLELEL